MKVVRFNDLRGTDREVQCPNEGFISYRYLLAKDGMGFSLHATFIKKGEPQHWHYTNHLEACLCQHGHGELVNLTTGERHNITSGDCYILDDHDDHTFQAHENTLLICIFNPPVTGREVHRADGSYAAAGE